MWTDFVDNVFLLNLEERSDRLDASEKELNRFDIPYTRWSAIKDFDGKAGLKLSIVQLFQYCLKNEYKRICVLEDDFSVLRTNFNELMDKCIEQLPEDFHLFYMGGNVWKQPTRKSANILQTPAIYSTHAIIYTKESMEYILKQLDSPLPYDTILVNSIQKLNKTYCSFPLLISQKNGYSDILKKEVKYDVYIEKRYEEKTKGI